MTCCSPFNSDQKENIPESPGERISIVPLPSSAEISNNAIDIANGVYVVPALLPSGIISEALDRFVINMKTMGISTSDPAGLPMVINIKNKGNITLSAEVEESYHLEILPESINITADNFIGLNYGLTSLGQLLFHSKESGVLQQMDISDHPRFPWRGLMIDVSRHWISKENILQNLDAMSISKMNVLHLHLSDDQGFRVESTTFPKLHTPGKFYSQDDIREIVAYAYDLGIRVIPEFDMPGHTTSWMTGYPDLGSKKMTYQLEENYGVFPNILNPTADRTYVFIKTLLDEMSRLFPDEYLHIGGDEIRFDHWEENDEIQQFMTENELVDPRQLSAYFHLRVQKIVKELGKKMIAWDDAIRPELEKEGVIIQSWRGHGKLRQSVKLGFNSISSSGWYLDHKLPMTEMYATDPTQNPNVVDITPDTSNFQIWKLDFQINDQPSEGSLLIFGLPGSQSGVINIMEGSTALNDVKMSDGKLDIQFSGTFGTASINADLEQDKLIGNLNLAVAGIPINGVKIGGHDMPDGIPLPKINSGPSLLEDDESRILGGEACLWTEWVNDQNLTSRIWPRTASVAEKLWSPLIYTQDPINFYQRVNQFSNYLYRSGIDYYKAQDQFISDLDAEINTSYLYSFIGLLEEVKHFERWSFDLEHNSSKELNNLVDVVLPESIKSFEFGQLISELESTGPSTKLNENIKVQIESWIPLYQNLKPVFGKDKMEAVEVLALALSDLCKIAIHIMESKTLTVEESAYYERLKANAQRKIDGVFLAPAPHLIRLIDRYRIEL